MKLRARSCNGYITTQTLREILRELDDKLTEDELDNMIEEIDADGSGTVDFAGCRFDMKAFLILKFMLLQEVFHVCMGSQMFTLLCPDGNIFDEQILACNQWSRVTCRTSSNFNQGLESQSNDLEDQQISTTARSHPQQSKIATAVPFQDVAFSHPTAKTHLPPPAQAQHRHQQARVFPQQLDRPIPNPEFSQQTTVYPPQEIPRTRNNPVFQQNSQQNIPVLPFQQTFPKNIQESKQHRGGQNLFQVVSNVQNASGAQFFPRPSDRIPQIAGNYLEQTFPPGLPTGLGAIPTTPRNFVQRENFPPNDPISSATDPAFEGEIVNAVSGDLGLEEEDAPPFWISDKIVPWRNSQQDDPVVAIPTFLEKQRLEPREREPEVTTFRPRKVVRHLVLNTVDGTKIVISFPVVEYPEGNSQESILVEGEQEQPHQGENVSPSRDESTVDRPLYVDSFNLASPENQLQTRTIHSLGDSLYRGDVFPSSITTQEKPLVASSFSGQPKTSAETNRNLASNHGTPENPWHPLPPAGNENHVEFQSPSRLRPRQRQQIGHKEQTELLQQQLTEQQLYDQQQENKGQNRDEHQLQLHDRKQESLGPQETPSQVSLRNPNLVTVTVRPPLQSRRVQQATIGGFKNLKPDQKNSALFINRRRLASNGTPQPLIAPHGSNERPDDVEAQWITLTPPPSTAHQ
ncbi:unnamed protein product [Darwinula stevensoni]|uniref:Chitin-binding type-2 domain-containing protein n=1 Tax=Darwinula stevensoni TaxID=69355 RepID=A0A7R8XDS9_9CRUS|nr:unnamed protein product [Darwinula stevensoni]CAG0893812.1 unnamed protein product [Darwinula stevensoni]